MEHEFEVRLEGLHARLGEVPAGDLARLLLAVERVIAFGSAHVINRPIGGRGPRPKAVVDASRIAIVALREGSVVPVLAIPDSLPPPGFAFETTPLGVLGLQEAIRAAQHPEAAPADLAGALAQLGRDVRVGSEYESVSIRFQVDGEERSVRLDRPRLQQLEDRTATAPRLAAGGIEGVLVEADFEALNGHIRTAYGRRIALEYPTDLADDVEEAIRQRRDFVGEVVYDASGQTIESLRLTGIQRQPALWEGLEPGEFWETRTVGELRVLQGATASTDVATLTLDVTDGEAEAFLEALGL